MKIDIEKVNNELKTDDILSILSQTDKGEAPISHIINGLRGSMRAHIKPESGRKWKVCGGPVDHLDMIEDLGFTTKFGGKHGSGSITLVTV